jgi:peptidoglycan/xylan/chitin deacetylase (PgdA/CDA1 family)
MLLDQGMEIGSHTMTHPILTSVDKPTLNRELAESKARLEDLTGNGVTSFCYPAGFHNAEVRAAVRRVGYSLGRTTMGFRTESTFDPFAMPVTAQMYPHGRRVHVTHSIRKRNIGGLAAWFGTYRASSDLETIAAAALQKVEQSGGVVHLWGHGWEIESLGIWPRLEILLDMLAEFVQSGAARSATNGEVVEALR